MTAPTDLAVERDHLKVGTCTVALVEPPAWSATPDPAWTVTCTECDLGVTGDLTRNDAVDVALRHRVTCRAAEVEAQRERESVDRLYRPPTTDPAPWHHDGGPFDD